MTNKFETIKCNLCGNDKYKIVFPAKYDEEKQANLAEKFRSSGDETLIDQVVKCKRCGLMYINPRLDPKLIVKGYSEGSDETFVSQAKGRAITFKKSMKLIEKYARRGGKILDIGTAGGTFLAVAKKRGWNVTGIEPNKWLCEWGSEKYNVPIYPGTLFDHKFKDGEFDVVTLWDVLEHVSEPTQTLEEINRILKPGGILVVNYPDAGSWIAKLLGRRWMFWLSVHLFYFTPKTIRGILKKTGFNTVKIKPHYQTLGLGYLVWRMKAYSSLLSSISMPFVKMLGMKEFQMPYWLGQTLVIARKKK